MMRNDICSINDLRKCDKWNLICIQEFFFYEILELEGLVEVY